MWRSLKHAMDSSDATKVCESSRALDRELSAATDRIAMIEAETLQRAADAIVKVRTQYLPDMKACKALTIAESEILALIPGQAAARLEEMRRDAADAAYYKWRLTEIMPLFEEARDALPAITLPSAKLHHIDLSLGVRMDAAGTRTREEFDAAIDAARKPT